MSTRPRDIGDPDFIRQAMTMLGQRPDLMQELVAAQDVTAALPPLIADPRVAMGTRGITPRQRQGHVPLVSELLQRLVAPAGDPAILLNSGLLHMIGSLKGDAARRAAVSGTVAEDTQSEDAWRMYLGMPQREGSLAISRFKPAQSSDPDAEYFRINEAWPKILELGDKITTRFGDRAGDPSNPLAAVLDILDANGGQAILNGDLVGLTALRNFTLAKGEDENGPYISYYDVFDLEQPLEGVVGQPFEIYDRLYYDPETLRPRTGPGNSRERRGR